MQIADALMKNAASPLESGCRRGETSLHDDAAESKSKLGQKTSCCSALSKRTHAHVRISSLWSEQDFQVCAPSGVALR